MAVKADDPRVTEGLARQHAGVVDEKFGRKIVRPVKDEIIGFNQIHDILCVDKQVMRDHLHVRIQRRHGLLCGVYLRLAYICVAVQDLPLEIGEIHLIRVRDADGSHTGRCQIHGSGRSEPAGPNDEDLRVQQLLLPSEPDFFQNDMPGVAFQLFTAQRHRNRLP